MYLHPELGLGFGAHARAGSQSIARTLQELGFRMVGSHHSGPPDDLTGLFLFANIRNPWDALASWWFYMGQDQREAAITPAWLERHVRTHPSYFPGGRGIWPMAEVLPLDQLVRFEMMEEDLVRILSRFGLPLPELPHLGESGRRERRPYTDFYTDAATSWVSAHFAPEIQRYGYHFLP